MNLINDNEIATKEIDLSKKVCGLDTWSIKWKSTRSRPKQAIHQYFCLSKELVESNEDVTLSIDGLQVNKVRFLTSVAHNLCCQTTQPLPAKTTFDNCVEKHEELDLLCKENNFNLKETHVDIKFKKSCNICNKKNSKIKNFNWSSAVEYAPRAEHNNRVIKRESQSCTLSASLSKFTKEFAGSSFHGCWNKIKLFSCIA